MEISKIIFYIIIAIISFEFIIERGLAYLNLKNWKLELPDKLKGIYDAEKYKKSMAYHKENSKFSSITSSLSFVILIAVLFLDGFAFLDDWVRNITTNPILMTLLFFGVIGLISEIIGLPFSYYQTFVIEEKYGFNKSSLKTFVLDMLKSWLLALILGGILISLIVWIYSFSGDYFWLLAWICISGFMIFMNLFYSQLIVPLFNKQTPLEEGDLRTEIEKFASKVDFKLDNIFVIDGSKRSSKANAYFSGLWKKKRIVLFDTLIKEQSVEEIVAVLAHEVGHYKKKHTHKQLILGLVNSAFMLFLLGLFIKQDGVLSEYLASAINAKPSFHIGILVFALLYSPISNIISVFSNSLSRKFEYQADRFASEHYSAEHLQNALINLSRNNLSNLNPHPAYVWYYYSHPPLLERIHHINEIKPKL
jgi:STE24 endopeptidase